MKLLALDLSTSCTGYAVFEQDSKVLLEQGTVRPTTKGLKAAVYPFGQLKKMIDLSEKILAVVNTIEDLQTIVVEEINPGKNRLGQKTLDGFHYVLMLYLMDHAPKIFYRDSDGADGWRTQLRLVLTPEDKRNNALAKKANKKLARGIKKFKVVSRKDKACEYVNKRFIMQLDCQERETDGDIADAIGLGIAALDRRNSGV